MPLAPKVSICIAAFNKPDLLCTTLQSIYRQHPPFKYEVIVVDDGSANNRIHGVCSQFAGLRYHRIEREPIYRNPCTARNVSYQMAESDILICQSDEVLHITPKTIELLVRELKPGTFVLANVFCLNKAGKVCGEYTGPCRQAPYFFLGSIFREDLFAVGCNDEEFAICPAYEDAWLGHCLINGRKLKPVYTKLVKGHHQWHEYVSKPETEAPSRELYAKKVAGAEAGLIPWCAAGGPWPFVPASNEVPVECTEPDQVEEVFTNIYRENHWGSEESRSGAGSTVDSTKLVRNGIELVIQKYGIKSVLDIPCGDFNWMRHVNLQDVSYTGCDIVKEIVEANRREYGSDSRKFEHMNVITSKLPQADLIFCRDCLGHFSQLDVKQALINMSRSGATWLMTTTFPKHKFNKPIETGRWTTINLEEPPFNLPPPLELVNEDCQEWYPHFNDKSLGLWRFQDIEPFNSIAVCVDYDDFLAITLPRNKVHFHKTLVVTAPHDTRTQELCRSLGVECYVTDIFYQNGAAFNKGAAMEEGFEVLGRSGWICVWDADIVMPASIRQPLDPLGLHTPARSILTDPTTFTDTLDWGTLSSPTQPCEFDGYFQLFHADSVKKPWYSIDWSHAGGCDSDFQFKFADQHKHRSPFHVLHLGEEGAPGIAARIGRNWRGRTLPRIDTGEVPAEAEARIASLRSMVKVRKVKGTGPEKIVPPVLNTVDNLPKRMCFFWTGPMSWLRYMTLKSFRHYHPDWIVELHIPTNLKSKRLWRTGEQDDVQHYTGPDYSEMVTEIGVIRKSWECPVVTASPAQASDLFQWQLLGNEKSFYADMDILWVDSLEPFRWEACENKTDAVFCLESGVMAIGFFGSNKFEFFRELYNLAAKSGQVLKHYQGCGTELVYDLLQISGSLIKSGNAGVKALKKLRNYYPTCNIVEAPSQTVYPFDWRQIDHIFSQVSSLPPGTIGIHWFGGSKLAQHWNKVLQPETWHDHSNTITKALERMMP